MGREIFQIIDEYISSVKKNEKTNKQNNNDNNNKNKDNLYNLSKEWKYKPTFAIENYPFYDYRNVLWFDPTTLPYPHNRIFARCSDLVHAPPQTVWLNFIIAECAFLSSTIPTGHHNIDNYKTSVHWNLKKVDNNINNNNDNNDDNNNILNDNNKLNKKNKSNLKSSLNNKLNNELKNVNNNNNKDDLMSNVSSSESDDDLVDANM